MLRIGYNEPCDICGLPAVCKVESPTVGRTDYYCAEHGAMANPLLAKRDADRTSHLVQLLAWMAEHGQSVDLNWGEDTGQWECSWITSGRRFVAVRAGPLLAATEALRLAREAKSS